MGTGDSLTSSLRNCPVTLWLVYLLLGNDSLNIYPQKQTHGTIGRLLLGSVEVNRPRQEYSMFSAWSVPEGYERTQTKEQKQSSSNSERTSFGTGACRDMSLGAEAMESSLRNWQSQNNGKKRN
jgi:hypothetical protein